MIYSMLRGIMIAIGITPPQPGNEKWVAFVFFGGCAGIAAAVLLLGAYLLHHIG